MKVLAPLDGSKQSRDALLQGLRLLADGGPSVTLLCVQEDALEESSEDLVAVLDEDEDDEVFPHAESAHRMLDEAAAAVKEAVGLDVKTKCVAGAVRKAILKEAGDGYDLLLMHGLHRSGVKEKLTASRTESLARRAPCSVLLVQV